MGLLLAKSNMNANAEKLNIAKSDHERRLLETIYYQ